NKEQLIGPVAVGDIVKVSIRYHPGSDTYSMGISVNGITRFGRGGTFKTTRGSAECIVEAPINVGISALADFGTATFTRCVAAQHNSGNARQIAAGPTDTYSVLRIDDTLQGRNAITGPASADGSSWSVTWLAP